MFKYLLFINEARREQNNHYLCSLKQSWIQDFQEILKLALTVTT